jgi:hypothetical protein
MKKRYYFLSVVAVLVVALIVVGIVSNTSRRALKSEDNKISLFVDAYGVMLEYLAVNNLLPEYSSAWLYGLGLQMELSQSGIEELAKRLNTAYPQHTFSVPEYSDWLNEKSHESNSATIYFETLPKHKGFNKVQLNVMVNNNLKVVKMSYTFRNGVWVLVSAEFDQQAFLAGEYTEATYENGILTLSEVDQYNITEAFFIKNKDDFIEGRVKYTDVAGNTYVFLDDMIIAYWTPDFGVDSSADTELAGESEYLSAINERMQTLIREYTDFSVTSMDPSDGGYKVLMHNTKSDFLQDTLTVYVGGDGEIRWFEVDYSELSDVSDDQINVANEYLANYLNTAGIEYTSYEYDLKFRLKGTEVIATYIISFKDSEGSYFSETASFVL